MQRLRIKERPDWQQIVENQGFMFHSIDEKYWDESVCYAFSEREILNLEKATNQLFEMCMEAMQRIIDKKLYALFKIPPEFHELIAFSWENDLPSIYGRFDLAYNGHEIKMLEFNADTPTSLLESAVIQWFWLQDFDKNKDQFNSIHEKLISHFKYLKPDLRSGEVHFACVKESVEDYMTVAYLMDCAGQAGLDTNFLYLEDIGYNTKEGRFEGIKNEKINTIFKLYPYEWMLAEEFGKYLGSTKKETHWIEPAWKMVLSNKMILRVLWEMFPNHQYLLETSLTPPLSGNYVRKPFLSREGANVQVVRYGKILAETQGTYGAEGYVYQQYMNITDSDGFTPVLGTWVIGGEAAGMGIRETSGLVTGNLSRFVPHYFV
ncbi:MAG: glutathionylspermidine synthase family protein [Verrucomicrobia bacterium]|nr:glutathionylspermidine synthase family protein [Cytophagales bacterium]